MKEGKKPTNQNPGSICYFQGAIPASHMRSQPILYHSESGTEPQLINHAERKSMLACTQHLLQTSLLQSASSEYLLVLICQKLLTRE